MFSSKISSNCGYCDYDSIKEDLICDWSIVGVMGNSLSYCLQIKPDLKLEEAALQNKARSETRQIILWIRWVKANTSSD